LSVIAVSISVSPFLTEEACRRHVHHVRAQPLARDLETCLRAGRGLEEQINLGAPAKRIAGLDDLAVGLSFPICEIEKRFHLVDLEPFAGHQVAVWEHHVYVVCHCH
jgi:hypothetical protein